MSSIENVMYMTDRTLYAHKMSIGRRLYANAVGDLIFAENQKGGLIVAEDDLALDAERLVELVCQSLDRPYPDLVIAYKTGRLSGMDKIKCPVATIFNEANSDQKTEEDLQATQPSHVFFHHAGDYAKWKLRLARQGKSAHLIHHCAMSNRHHGVYAERNDLGIAGVLGDEIYPVRTRLSSMTGVNIRRHPGYRLPSPHAQYDSYQEWLAQHRVVICCTSIYRYPLAKICEALHAGCMVLTDKPDCPFIARFAAEHPESIQFIDEGFRDMLVSDRPASVEAAKQLIHAQAMEMVHQFDQGGPDALRHRVAVARENFSLQVWAENFLSVF